MSDRQRGGYRMTNDPAQTDLDRVHRWLSEESYWSAGSTYEAVARSIWAAMAHRPVQNTGNVNWSAMRSRNRLGNQLWEQTAVVREARGRVAQESVPAHILASWAQSVNSTKSADSDEA